MKIRIEIPNFHENSKGASSLDAPAVCRPLRRLRRALRSADPTWLWPNSLTLRASRTSSQQLCKSPRVTLWRDGTREAQMPARCQFLPSWLVWA